MLPYLLACGSVALLSMTSAAVVVWCKKPALVLRAAIWLALWRCGLRIQYVRGRHLVYCYAERGRRRHDRSTVVFVHGFSAAKDNWVPIIQWLPEDWHIIAVDLPGHGNTSLPPSSESVSVQSMVEGLRELLTVAKVNTRPLHLIGTSMGGTIVGLYAAQYPQEVERLTLVCPAVITPAPSRFMLDYRHGTNHLLPSNEDEIRQLFNALIYHKERAPQNTQLLKGVLQMRQRGAQFYEKLFRSIAEKSDKTKEEELVKTFSNISVPTQIMWGQNDEMIDVSGANKLRQLLPDCRRVDIIPECGHSVGWDQPKSAAEFIFKFRQQSVNWSNTIRQTHA